MLIFNLNQHIESMRLNTKDFERTADALIKTLWWALGVAIIAAVNALIHSHYLIASWAMLYSVVSYFYIRGLHREKVLMQQVLHMVELTQHLHPMLKGVSQ